MMQAEIFFVASHFAENAAADLFVERTACSLFSPAGRRRPEGSDEGVREAPLAYTAKTSSSPRMRSALLPAGEKRKRAFRLMTRRILA
jgi:hypothetical protein